MGQKLIYVPECHSTNSLLNDLNDSSRLPEGTVLITDRQTAGRGQRGNTWDTAPGKNLTFSVLLCPSFLNVQDQFRLNMAVSLAIIGSLRFFVPEIKLKWPNDIFVDERKIGGILIENQIQGTFLSNSIVGIGLNINQEEFSLATATSIYRISGQLTDLNMMFQRLIESLEGEYLDLRTGRAAQLKSRYLKSLYKFNEAHRFESSGENFTGSIFDVDDSGRLCVETIGGSRVFSFKEVKFLS